MFEYVLDSKLWDLLRYDFENLIKYIHDVKFLKILIDISYLLVFIMVICEDLDYKRVWIWVRCGMVSKNQTYLRKNILYIYDIKNQYHNNWLFLPIWYHKSVSFWSCLEFEYDLDTSRWDLKRYSLENDVKHIYHKMIYWYSTHQYIIKFLSLEVNF